MKRILAACCAALVMVVSAAYADTLKLKDDFPDVYIVKKGDTLWDISALYLHSPWLWPRLWQYNAHIDNPHLIYPGDRLSLVYIDGEPRLTRKRVVSLSPKIRTKNKADAIPTLPLASIHAFLSRDHFIEEAQLEGLPYVLGDNDGHTRIALGRAMYARGQLEAGQYYGVYRLGTEYHDPQTKERLGRGLIYLGIGMAQSNHEDNIARFEVKQVEREMNLGDILLPLPDQDSLPVYFQPSAAKLDGSAHILSAANDDRSVMGAFDVVIINKGARDALKPGDMLSLNQPGKVMVDKVARKSYEEQANAFDRVFNTHNSKVSLPNEQVGQMMVFKVYDKVSYALITNTKVPATAQFIVESL